MIEEKEEEFSEQGSARRAYREEEAERLAKNALERGPSCLGYKNIKRRKSLASFFSWISGS